MSVKEQNRLMLSVIHGEATQKSGVKPSLVLVPQRRSAPQQLTIPGLPLWKKELLSLGCDNLGFSTFAQILKSGAVKHIADVRVSPSFSGRGFSPPAVNLLLAELKIEYVHFPMLANRFIGSSWNRHAVMERYVEHLKEQREALQNLHEKLTDGPVLLLGTTPQHEQSARLAIVNELAAVKNDFSLCIISP